MDLTTNAVPKAQNRLGSVSADKSNGKAQWAIVYTHPHREHIALDNLARQEFQAYCPRIRRTIRHGRRTRQVLRPLFPNYLFVQTNSTLRSYRPILSTLGVRNLVRFGDRPAVVADDFVRHLKAREIDGAIVRPPTPYRTGQKVRVATGPFDGIVATIIEIDEKDRLVTLLNFFNRPVTAKFATEMVSPV